MSNASHYNQLLSSALSGIHSSCLPTITTNILHDSHYPHEYAQHEIWQEYPGAYTTSPPPTISPEDFDLLNPYTPMQLPPATPFLSGTPLPNFDDISFDFPLAESCLPSWDVPETCPSIHQNPHVPVNVSLHNVHDESGHINDAPEHFSGSRCAESSIPTNQSRTQEEPTPSPAKSPPPNVDQLKGEGSSSRKKVKGGRTKTTKQPSKPEPRRQLKRENLANNLKLTASSDWSSDGIEEADANTKPRPSTGRRVYGSKNLASERKRRIKLNEKLLSLRALVPRISKMDKASIVADAIDYVKDLHKQLKSTEDDILAIQAGTYLPTQKGLSSHASEGVDAQPHKQANIPQHKIIEMHVSIVEPKMYHLLIHCERGHGVLLQLTKALEALNLKIFSASLTTVIDLVINTIIIKADEVSKAEDFEELLKNICPTYGLHF